MFRIGIHHTRTLIDRNSHWDRHRHESTIVCCRSCSWHCARHRARCRVRRANLGIFRYRARAHEPAAARHATFMSGEQLLLLGSPQNHRLYNSDDIARGGPKWPDHLSFNYPTTCVCRAQVPSRRRRACVGGGFPPPALYSADASCRCTRPMYPTPPSPQPQPRNRRNNTTRRRDGASCELASGWCISAFFILRN